MAHLALRAELVRVDDRDLSSEQSAVQPSRKLERGGCMARPVRSYLGRRIRQVDCTDAVLEDQKRFDATEFNECCTEREKSEPAGSLRRLVRGRVVEVKVNADALRRYRLTV